MWNGLGGKDEGKSTWRKTWWSETNDYRISDLYDFFSEIAEYGEYESFEMKKINNDWLFAPNFIQYLVQRKVKYLKIAWEMKSVIVKNKNEVMG